jgi:hypothetical protein
MTSTVEISELCQYGPWRDAYRTAALAIAGTSLVYAQQQPADGPRRRTARANQHRGQAALAAQQRGAAGGAQDRPWPRSFPAFAGQPRIALLQDPARAKPRDGHSGA